MTALSASMAVPTGRVQLVTIRRQSLVTARWRVLWVALVFAVVAFIAVLRIFHLGLSDRALTRTSLEEALLPPRGEITDRNGTPLARAFPAYALWYNPEALGDGGTPLVRPPAEIAEELAAIFPSIDPVDVAEKLASGRAGYLRRRVLPEEANRVQALGELALEMPRESDRHYPQGSMGAHILGYVAADGHGRVGMEQVLDKHLTDPATRADPIPLSIDARVQGALEDELRKGMLAVNAMGAAGIVLDVDTGEVMALASLPEFDPNRIDEEGEKNMFNRVTNQVYELGSTFKPITVAAAIDAGVVRDFGKPWNATPVQVGRFSIKDLKPKGEVLNVPQTLIYSSNTVTARVADELGAKRLRQTLIDLGMNERPYIELPARGFPIWPGDDWPRLRNMTVSYGHGIAVTPLHLASAYAAMVNGGIWRPATLRKLEPGAAPRGRRVFKASTSSRMRQLLRMITIYGTGKNADAPGYRVGGKTGSAEKPGNGGYRQSSLVSTFAAAFPMDRPRYVVIAMLDEPHGTVASSFQRTAGWTAAPIVGKLVPRIGPVLGIRPDATRDVDISDLKPLVVKGKS
ncbi:cell division protein FtsI (penicillin-binding protein 3) [Altererythrobacter xiamenensis]|uniref:Cell division protein FtsI (Penicillin-binding protein 3) n=1 Tax=Altererythrobacter xiamenensis TaxID=1316679 RepID=A0A1Y6EKI7_9SPHN|nr:penicillin-binding protein 2 [Altererythrobacter xiamenensis]SMQ61721.1 cell division protein FtsI (penicillin-binding protein 3) [Altererythrobacter xiamenensis]